jgi:hypothetical protein
VSTRALKAHGICGLIRELIPIGLRFYNGNKRSQSPAHSCGRRNFVTDKYGTHLNHA